MTQMELQKYINKTGRLVIKESIIFKVVVEDCKITYGKLRLKVKPTHYEFENRGSIWVDYMYSVNGQLVEYQNKDIKLELNMN